MAGLIGLGLDEAYREARRHLELAYNVLASSNVEPDYRDIVAHDKANVGDALDRVNEVLDKIDEGSL